MTFKRTEILTGVLVLVSLLFFSFTGKEGEEKIISGERIPVGIDNGRGPLSIGVQSNPVGQAYVFAGDEPDLFVMSGKHNFSPEPGLYLFKWIARDEKNAPVFGSPVKVKFSVSKRFSKLPAGTVWQDESGTVYGFWLADNKIYITTFNKDKKSFVPTGKPVEITGLPEAPAHITNLNVLPLSTGELQIVLTVNDGVKHKPDGNKRGDDYRVYDGAGVFLGKWPYEYLMISGPVRPKGLSSVSFRQFSSTRKEVLLRYQGLTRVKFTGTDEYQVLTGSWFGNLLFYPWSNSAGQSTQKLIVDENGNAVRYKSPGAVPVAYPDKDTKVISDLIVGGESELMYYHFTGDFDDNGSPVYEKPVEVLLQDAKLYSGSLPVLTAVDWDGNGTLDIVSGNSEGRVLVFYNRGKNESPAFENGTPLEVCGHPIHFQSGYSGSVQGPEEARWGYSCPTVTDWNNDGLSDVVMGSTLGNYKVYLNVGTQGKPELDMPAPIYHKGLDLHGTWRVQPGIAKMKDHTCMVILDDDDEFHMYYKLDDFNVVDKGKLRLNDGSVIKANFLRAGGTGRLKIVLYDWDDDGLVDILVGSPRHGSVPDPENGLPQSKGLKGAAVLFLKNVGTNEKPAFQFPKLMKFKGKPIYLGQHTCSPAVWDYGQEGGADLLVGEQDGNIRFYSRKDLSW